MYLSNSKKGNRQLGQFAVLAAATLCSSLSLSAANFAAPAVFATGGAVNSTGADSVTYGNGSVWIEYSNAASSRNYTGTSSIVQYSTSGVVQSSYSLSGSVDGLKFNPNTGTVWALQNQDALSQLSILNPATKTISAPITYGAPYTGVSGSRGFDDVAFIGNSVYMSQTNPASTSDAVVTKLNSSNPSSPIGFTTVLTGAGLLATDPDSLKATPTGNLVLTGEGDGALNFINNPGQANQSATALKLSGVTATGAAIGAPDDSVYATAASGTFYLTDTTANTVYSIFATGLIPNSSLFVNVGNEFGSVDPSTGVVTEIMAGTGLHGLEFVPSASAVPEPSTLGISLAGLGFAALAMFRKRFVK